jgi:hypothetical protein
MALFRFPLARALFLTLLALPLAACQPKAITPAQDAELRAVVERLHQGDIQGIEAAFDAKYLTPTVKAGLPGLPGMFPPGQPQIQPINTAADTDKAGVLSYGATYEYDYPGVGLLTQVEMIRAPNGPARLMALRVVRAPQPHLLDHYRFSLAGKPAYQYGFLMLMILSPLLGLWGIVAVWRADDLGRRWKPIWTLAMAIGFMDLTMDWADGRCILTVRTLHILYLSAAKFSPISPWMLSCSLPLASIAFLIGYRPFRNMEKRDGD